MPKRLILILLIANLTSGCEFGTPESARKFAEIPAEQNRQTTELQRQLQSQQAALNEQRDGLERQRQQIAEQRVHDPLVANALQAGGTLLACLIPVLLAWVLLRQGHHEPAAEVMVETILQDIAQGPTSVLIPALAAPTFDPPPRLAVEPSSSTSKDPE